MKTFILFLLFSGNLMATETIYYMSRKVKHPIEGHYLPEIILNNNVESSILIGKKDWCLVKITMEDHSTLDLDTTTVRLPNLTKSTKVEDIESGDIIKINLAADLFEVDKSFTVTAVDYGEILKEIGKNIKPGYNGE